MATFINTVQFTHQGMKDIKATCQRAASFQAAAANMGVEVQNIFWTLGPFDGVESAGNDKGCKPGEGRYLALSELTARLSQRESDFSSQSRTVI